MKKRTILQNTAQLIETRKPLVKTFKGITKISQINYHSIKSTIKKYYNANKKSKKVLRFSNTFFYY